jgi:hypothetical protein
MLNLYILSPQIFKNKSGEDKGFTCTRVTSTIVTHHIKYLYILILIESIMGSRRLFAIHTNFYFFGNKI